MLKPSLNDALRVWSLLNLDTFETVSGQFHAEELTHDVGSAYSEKFALNRQHAITQFLHGEVEQYSFRSRFHATTVIEDAEAPLNMLKRWARRDESSSRPPVLEFWAGNGHAFFVQCTMKLSGITYDRPTWLGGLRHVTFTVTLREYKEFSLKGETVGNTRYHRSKRTDYYELLTEREYSDPMLGDVIRKIHPDKPNVQVGDVIMLPTASHLRKSRTTQTSIALQNGFGRKDSPQRTLRLAMFESRNRPRFSHTLVE